MATTSDAGMLTRERLMRYRAAGGDAKDIIEITDPIEAQRLSRLKSANVCWSWPAATLQPRKLAAHIMRRNLEDNVSLYTHTTVQRVKQAESTSLPWEVCTDRGNITCTSVVHATNAYAQSCETFFQDVVHAYPHICNRISPPSSFSGDNSLQNSYGVILPNDAYFSINPRSNSDHEILIGGECHAQKALKHRIDRAEPEVRADDSIQNVKAVDDEVRKFLEEEFVGWSSDTVPSALSSWSGIIGLTNDEVPLVGEIPGRPGQWACVGFNGHGMALIWEVVPGLVQLMQGQSWGETSLPEAFRLSSERANKLRKQAPREI